MNSLDFSLFPPPPIAASARLVPLASWYEVVQEANCTGIEFDDFWLDSVHEHVAYLFSWRGPARATVLAVWEDDELKHVECRTIGDRLCSPDDSAVIEAEIKRLFGLAKFKFPPTCH